MICGSKCCCRTYGYCTQGKDKWNFNIKSSLFYSQQKKVPGPSGFLAYGMEYSTVIFVKQYGFQCFTAHFTMPLQSKCAWYDLLTQKKQIFPWQNVPGAADLCLSRHIYFRLNHKILPKVFSLINRLLFPQNCKNQYS